MPKISQQGIRCSHKEIDKYYTIEVHYNSELFFYSKVPDEFDEAFDLLENKEAFSAYYHYKSSGDRRNEINKIRVVKSKTEQETIAFARNIIEHLMSSSIKRRDVIILFFSDATTRYNGHTSEDKFPSIGMQVSMTYCEETKLGENKIVYNKYSQDIWNSDRRTRQEIRIYRQDCTIVDDTPENRIFLENLYSALTNLIVKIKDFTATPEALIKLIASNQKLLN